MNYKEEKKETIAKAVISAAEGVCLTDSDSLADLKNVRRDDNPSEYALLMEDLLELKREQSLLDRLINKLDQLLRKMH